MATTILELGGISLIINCKCGSTLQVSGDLDDRTIRCPNCKSQLRVVNAATNETVVARPVVAEPVVAEPVVAEPVAAAPIAAALVAAAPDSAAPVVGGYANAVTPDNLPTSDELVQLPAVNSRQPVAVNRRLLWLGAACLLGMLVIGSAAYMFLFTNKDYETASSVDVAAWIEQRRNEEYLRQTQSAGRPSSSAVPTSTPSSEELSDEEYKRRVEENVRQRIANEQKKLREEELRILAENEKLSEDARRRREENKKREEAELRMAQEAELQRRLDLAEQRRAEQRGEMRPEQEDKPLDQPQESKEENPDPKNTAAQPRRAKDDQSEKDRIRRAEEKRIRELEQREKAASKLMALQPETFRSGDDFRVLSESADVEIIVGLEPPYDHTVFKIDQLYEGDLKNTAPEFPEAAKEYGIKYFPPVIDRIGFWNLARMRKTQDQSIAPASNSQVQEICRLTGIKLEEIDWITTGTAFNSVDSLSHPVLMIVKLSSAIKTESESLQKLYSKQFGKDEIRYTSAGRAIGIVDPNTIAIGTTNEVLFAKRKLGFKARHTGFEWLDYSKYDAVAGEVYRYGGRITPLPFEASQGDLVQELKYIGNAGWASVLASEHNMRAEMFRGERTIAGYLGGLTKVLAATGEPPAWSSNYPVYLAAFKKKVTEEPEKWPLTPKELVARSEGRITIRELRVAELMERAKSVPREVPWRLATSSREVVARVLGNYSGLNDETKGYYESVLEDYRKANAAFEGLRFRDEFSRKQLQEKIANAAEALIDGPEKHLNPERVSRDLLVALDNTSSAFVRAEIIRSLAKKPSPIVLRVLASEGRKREIFADLASDPANDDPHRFSARNSRPSSSGSRSSSSGKDDSDLIELASYYLQCGATAHLVRDSCQILRAIDSRDAREGLEDYFKALHPTAAQREYVKKNIVNLAPQEPYFEPNSQEQAIEWLKSTNRSKKYSALTALLQDGFLPEANQEVMPAVVMLLDDSLLYDLAGRVLAKRMKEPDFAFLHEVIENLLENKNFRARQNFSVYRVVDVMAEVGDAQGLAKASLVVNEGLFRLIVHHLHASQIDKTPILQMQLDQIAAKKNVEERIEYLALIGFLTTEQKELIQTWTQEQFEDGLANPLAVKVLTNTKTITKQMIPELVSIWAKSGSTIHEITKYLKQCGPGVEQPVIESVNEALDKGVRFSSYEIAFLFDKIGTQRCAPTIERVLATDPDLVNNPQRQKIEASVRSLAQKISSLDRNSLDFEDWDHAAWFKSLP
ncbi:MAG: hypothetical protein AAF483_09115 [Planctomycetota bacterium]